MLRSLIDRIDLRPRGKGQGIAATLHGDLAQILALCDDSGRKQKLPKVGASGSPTVGGCGGGIHSRTYQGGAQEGCLRLLAGARNHREPPLPPIGVFD